MSAHVCDLCKQYVHVPPHQMSLFPLSQLQVCMPISVGLAKTENTHPERLYVRRDLPLDIPSAYRIVCIGSCNQGYITYRVVYAYIFRAG
jgi:hypothetical protein